MSDDGNNTANTAAREREVSRMWRVYRTVKEMISDREYEISEEEVHISLDDFRRRYINDEGMVSRDMMQFSARPSDNMIAKSLPVSTSDNPTPAPDCGVVFVQFLDSDTVGAQPIKDFIELVVNKQHARVGILVSRVPITPAARKTLAAGDGYEGASFEHFLEEDLLVNITHHELVPRHVLLSREEKAALLKRYRLKDTQLPRILSKDPVARYYGLKRGQVVKIIRPSETAGRYASYRLCV